jgi:hypothetical protein
MAALTTDKQVIIHSDHKPRTSYGVKTAVTIYDGALICAEAADGFARPCAASLTSPEFYGLAVEQVVAGAGASGTKQVTTIIDCIIEVTAIATATGVTDIGSSVYAVTDNVGDLTLSSTNNVLVGKVTDYIADAVAGNRFRVHLVAASL